MLQRAAVILFGPCDSVRYLHSHDPALGTTPAAAAWIGGEVALRAGAQLLAHARCPAPERVRPALVREDSCL
jgi:hypothetical protein